MKKILILILCAAVSAATLISCGSSTKTNLSNTTATGKVTSIKGTSVTLLLGEFIENTMNGQPGNGPSDNGQPGGSDSNGADVANTIANNVSSAYIASDDTTSGGASSGNAPSGNAPSGNAPSGNAPSGNAPSGNAPSGGAFFGRRGTFTAGSESVTITIGSTATITIENMRGNTTGTIDSIKVDDILTVTFGDSNTVTAVTVMSTASGGNGGNGGSGGRPEGGMDGNGSGANANDNGNNAGVNGNNTNVGSKL